MENKNVARNVATNLLQSFDKRDNVDMENYRLLRKISVSLFEEHGIEEKEKLQALLRAKVEHDYEKHNDSDVFIQPLEKIDKDDENSWIERFF